MDTIYGSIIQGFVQTADYVCSFFEASPEAALEAYQPPTPEQQALELYRVGGEVGENRDEAVRRILACINNPEQKVLDLSSLDLREVPNLIFDLDLEKLDLYDNELSILSTRVGKLVHLKDLSLQNNPIFTLPKEFAQLKQLKVLNLMGSRITTIPEEIFRLGQLESLRLGNTRISVLPREIKHLSQLKALHLSSTRLEAIPEEIANLPQLKLLNLRNANIRSLPPQIGNLQSLAILILEDNPNLTAIPNELLELDFQCNVYLMQTGLSASIRNRLHAMVNHREYTGPTIHYSINERRSAQEDVRSPKAILEGLANKVSQDPINIDNLIEDENFAATLQEWVAKLSYISEFKSGGDQQAALIKDALTYVGLANRDPEFRDVFLGVITEGIETCGDRMALSVISLGIQHQISQMDKSDLHGLAHLLGRGVWAINLLREKADEKIQTLKFVDEIEVRLGFLIMLKKELDLPLNLGKMLYFACSHITPVELARAKAFVLEHLNDKKAFAKFLIGNNTWMAALKASYSEEVAAIEAQREDLIDQERYDAYDNLLINLTEEALGWSDDKGKAPVKDDV